ncbi:3-deoxy-D-manno-octulosonic acid transferase [Falsihalocynthiibacter sp. SS001]|uniref:3-deoxy-D-manno-octulosonic acid transferase n=1 Tax=Falsihalocynthiibacter sp. SS001 TaxID=3349698 RepID=UPI0036D42120
MSFSLSLYLRNLSRRTADMRAQLESENTQGAAEEMGKASVERPEGSLLWFHAPDATKARALTKLIRQLSDDWQTVNFLLTTPRSSTSTFSTDALPPRCIHQFSCAEAPEFVEKFLSYWKPDIAVFSGVDVDPVTVLCTSKKRIPLYLLDVKLDNHAHAGLRSRVTGRRAIMREVLRCFDRIDAIDATSARALNALGVDPEKTRIAGPLEDVSEVLPCNEEDRTRLATALAGRPVWLATKVPDEEDTIVLDAHLAASRIAHRLLLILVPDVSQRGPELAEKYISKGARVRVRSLGEMPDSETQIYIADTDGERGLWYRLATVSYLGGSLVAGHTTHSPYEAAGLGSAILHGIQLGPHQAAFEALDAEGGARCVETRMQLTSALLALLAPDQSAAMAHAAWDLATKGARATDLAISQIESMLEEIGAY